MNKIRVFALLLWGALSALPVCLWAADVTFREDELTIRSGAATSHFDIEIAETTAQKELGFMHRTMLHSDHGMLFIFKQEQAIAMWMKDTPLPLDMLFIDAHGKIIYIAAKTKPNSTDIIAAKKPALAVLELLGGTAASKNIRVGDRVVHAYFKP